jgi:hypothetical protein
MVKIVRIQTGGHSCFLEGLVRISWPKERTQRGKKKAYSRLTIPPPHARITPLERERCVTTNAVLDGGI